MVNKEVGFATIAPLHASVPCGALDALPQLVLAIEGNTQVVLTSAITQKPNANKKNQISQALIKINNIILTFV